MTNLVSPTGNLGGLNPQTIVVRPIASSALSAGQLVSFDIDDATAFSDISKIVEFDDKRCPFNVVLSSPTSVKPRIYGVVQRGCVAGERAVVAIGGVVQATVSASGSSISPGDAVGPDVSSGGILTNASSSGICLGVMLGIVASPVTSAAVSAGQQRTCYVLFSGDSGASSLPASGSLLNANSSGTSSTQLNYVFNSAVNSIQGSGTDANVWANTISGGGNSAQPNLIRGSTSLRTIAGGYDNIIGRDATAFPSDGTATIQSQILCGAHNRIFLNGDTNFPSGQVIPVNNGVTHPTHSTIAGGSYHQIRNGDYGFIGGGTNCVIQEKAGSEAYADGQGAFIGGGFKNIAYGKQSVIAGGNTNVNECQNSAIGGGVINSILTPKDSGGTAKTSCVISGGSNNTINCSGAAAIVGGELNKISATSGTTDLGLYSFIGGGYNNQIATSLYSPYSVVCGGFQNTVNNQFSAIVGGRSNLVSSLYCTAIGYQANARNYGGFVHGGQAFSSAGDAQTSVYVMKCETTSTTPVEMLSMGQPLAIPSDTSWAFRALIVARHGSSNSSAGYEVKGLIHNDSGTAAIVGTVSVTVLGESTTPTSMTACDATADASGANLRIMVTGLATSVKWVARLEITEVTG